MNRKTAIIALFAALILLAVVLYINGQRFNADYNAAQTAIIEREIQIFLSLTLTPHA